MQEDDLGIIFLRNFLSVSVTTAQLRKRRWPWHWRGDILKCIWGAIVAQLKCTLITIH